MRTLVILLILANLTLFGYTQLDGVGSGEGVRLAQQVQADKITLLTPQQVAALGPAKASALADVCAEWGPFSDAERGRALADLDPLALGKLLAQKRVETNASQWVYLPPLANKAAADRRATELRSAGLKDVVVVDGGPQRFALSLGAFTSEDAANAYVADLRKRGVDGARAGAREQVVVQTSLVVRDPPQAAVARLREISPGYAGTELRLGSCDKPA
jgi:SPOR domain